MKQNNMPMVSIIMPSYNSQMIIEGALESIKKQDYPSELIEILVIDGGSTDGTTNIAEKYGAKVLYNERRLPEFAKKIGFENASGRYGVYLDTDERFESETSIRRRIELFLDHPEIKNITSTGGPAPKEANVTTRYACRVGDPFSNFVYMHYDGWDYTKTANREFRYEYVSEAYIYNYDESKYYPLYDGLGAMFDIVEARKIQKEEKVKDISTDIFRQLVSRSKRSAILVDDYVIHDQHSTFKKYLSKIKWRVKNNLFGTDCVGFVNRQQTQKVLSIRKYLFIPYSVLIIPTLFDGIVLSVKCKDARMMIHFVFSEMTFFYICWFMLLKMLHITPKMDTVYGK